MSLMCIFFPRHKKVNCVPQLPYSVTPFPPIAFGLVTVWHRTYASETPVGTAVPFSCDKCDAWCAWLLLGLLWCQVILYDNRDVRM